MNKVECTGKYLLMNVKHKGITYECLVSSDCKDLFRCEPEPMNLTEIETIIRDAAWCGEITNFNELG